MPTKNPRRSVTRAEMPSIPGISTLRARSYLSRLPLFTRAIVLVIVLFWALGLQSVWDLRQWGALIPDKINIAAGMLDAAACPRDSGLYTGN